MSALALLGYPASLLMGLALGLTGGGGSILAVPILVYLFGIGALEATAYSLGLVGLVAVWGAWGAYRSGDLNLKRALYFGIPGVIGVLISRRILLPALPEKMAVFGLGLSQSSIILIAFSVLMLIASGSMISSSFSIPSADEKGIAREKVSKLSLGSVGLAIGLLAGFVGAGGGFLVVPALVKLGKLEMKQAIGTSLFVIALQSLLGIMGDIKAIAQMDHVLFFSMTILSISGMSLGTLLRKYVSSSKLKLGFGIFVLAMGSLILFQEFKKGTV